MHFEFVKTIQYSTALQNVISTYACSPVRFWRKIFDTLLLICDGALHRVLGIVWILLPLLPGQRRVSQLVYIRCVQTRYLKLYSRIVVACRRVSRRAEAIAPAALGLLPAAQLPRGVGPAQETRGVAHANNLFAALLHQPERTSTQGHKKNPTVRHFEFYSYLSAVVAPVAKCTSPASSSGRAWITATTARSNAGQTAIRFIMKTMVHVWAHNRSVYLHRQSVGCLTNSRPCPPPDR